MKKIFAFAFAASLMLLSASANAQIHIDAGYVGTNEITTSATLSGTTSKTAHYNGLYAGFGYTLNLGEYLAVDPAVRYTYSKCNEKTWEVADAIYGTYTGTEQRVEGIIDLQLRFPFSKDFKAFIYAGPRYTYAFSSKGQMVYTAAMIEIKRDVDKFDENSTSSHSNVLVGGGIGVDIMQRFRIKAGYDFGLMNLYTGSASDYSVKQNMINAGVAVLF